MYGEYNDESHSVLITPYSFSFRGDNRWDVDTRLHRRLNGEKRLTLHRLIGIGENNQPQADIETVAENEQNASSTEIQPATSTFPSMPTFALVNLFGSWVDGNESDRKAVGALVSKNHPDWDNEMRELIQQAESPLKLKEGVWKIKDRQSSWRLCGSRIYDRDLDAFIDIAVEILGEKDPGLDLNSGERMFAKVVGQTREYSEEIRKSVATTVALLGCYSSALTNCSADKPMVTATLIVRKVFTDADWKTWASNLGILTLYAEAAPDEFLSIVEDALSQNPCPFDEIFAQEFGGVFGRTYIADLLWALELLAWEDEYFVRVCSILGILASRDPGGQWSNRPINSLITILLPWYPQTLAPAEKRYAAVNKLVSEFPDVAWEVVRKLLPNQQHATTDNYRPKWRQSIPADWKENVSIPEYPEQVIRYSSVAVQMAKADMRKVPELISIMHYLDPESIEDFMVFLSSDDMVSMPMQDRLPIWEGLRKFVSEHKKFSDAEWALKGDLLNGVESALHLLAPNDPLLLYRHLFSGYDYDLYETTKYEEEALALTEKRLTAIKEIIQEHGIEVLFEAPEVEENGQDSSRQYYWTIGCTLAHLDDADVESQLIPQHLKDEDLTLLGGYVRMGMKVRGYQWVDGVDRQSWEDEETAIFLRLLPFTQQTWNRVDQWLPKKTQMYWNNISANEYELSNADEMEYAIEKLLAVDRPIAAFRCLMLPRGKDDFSIDARKYLSVLLATLLPEQKHKEPFPCRDDQYRVVQVVKLLQNSEVITDDEKCKVELASLPLLSREYGTEPTTLWRKLADDPQWFIDVIELIVNGDDHQQSAGHLLLENWRVFPGDQDDSGFSEEKFCSWFNAVKLQYEENDHGKSAISNLGKVFVFAPADKDGLWMHRAVAKVLDENSELAEILRRGYKIALFYSRGIHTVDPSGAPERALAEYYRERAESIERAGFVRIATALRSLSKEYTHKSKRVIMEHEEENEDA
jgi:hypothetical protein